MSNSSILIRSINEKACFAKDRWAWMLMFWISIHLLSVSTVYCKQPAIHIIEEYAHTAASSLIEQIGRNQAICRTIMVPFRGYRSVGEAKFLESNSLGNSDERYFGNCLLDHFVKSKVFNVYTREKLNKALEELTLQFNDIFDPQTAKEVGRFAGADLVIITQGYIGRDSGRSFGLSDIVADIPLSSESGSFRVEVMAIDVETGEIRGYWKKYRMLE